ncbi:MAG: TrkH family potassium uptake protein [Clostridiales Family XIII bacterium]|nr:TrkH family potassium uptake protein [Clostridiales Family XIII bacterium]
MKIQKNLILNVLGIMMVLTGVTMVGGLLSALLLREFSMAVVFLATMIPMVLVGFLLYRITKRKNQVLKMRDGLVATTLCWVFAIALAAMPFMFSGAFTSYIDAVFEAATSITTTGATLIADTATVPKSLMFWKAFLNWFGGIGILLLAISILPAMGVGAANLVSAETSGNSLSNIRNRMRDIAKRIFLIYLILTVTEYLLLIFSELGIYDSLILTFQSVGNGEQIHTGGGMMGYGNIYVEVVVALFCILSALSFINYPLLFKKRFREFFSEPEFRMFITVLAVLIVVVSTGLIAAHTYGSPGEALRQGALGSIAFTTTAGFQTEGFDEWPQFIQWLLLFAMAIGGCSASTSGGIKMVRLSVLFSVIKRNVYKRVHPNAVVSVKVGGRAISDDKVSMIITFTLVYILITIFSCILLSLENYDMKSTVSTVISMLSNTGTTISNHPGIEYFSDFSPFSKLYMVILMITGRLEVMTVFLLFMPAFWRTSK